MKNSDLDRTKIWLTSISLWKIHLVTLMPYCRLTTALSLSTQQRNATAPSQMTHICA